MKKILACVLLLAMTLYLCSCGSSNDTGNDTDTNTEQNNEVSFDDLTPSTDLPALSAEFEAILDHTYITESTVNRGMSYVLTAYNTYDADTFCTYMYTVKPLNHVEDIQKKISEAADELMVTNISASLEVRSCSLDLLTAASHLQSWITAYAGYEANKGAKPSVDELVRAINEYAQIFYGQNLL